MISALAAALLFVGCNDHSNSSSLQNTSSEVQETGSSGSSEADEDVTKKYVSIEDFDSVTIYYPVFSRVDLATGSMPDKMTDTNVVFCCAAAFTGEHLLKFKHTNIAGDHVSSGKRYSGYTCKRNSGAFVWYDGQWKFVWNDYSGALDTAAANGGMGFGQEMIIDKGKLCKTTRRDENVNQFRALCEIEGKLCIVDCKMEMPFGSFKKQLLAHGATEALYVDMGTGWNHSWYRDENGKAVDIFPYRHPFCTNWLAFYK